MKRILAGALGLFLLSLVPNARAELAPEAYQQLRDAAPVIALVEVVNVREPGLLTRWFGQTGVCAVRGRVVKLYRDANQALREGQEIVFPLTCHLPDGWSGPTRAFDPAIVSNTRFIKGHFTPASGEHPGRFVPAAHGHSIQLFDASPLDSP